MNMALLDTNFLRELDEQNEREVYVKIISLDFNENPRAEIQGYATGGSINNDGASAVRRTCNVSLITNNLAVSELDWTLETKFKLSIGLKNRINKSYDDIIWFDQGIYIITSFSSTANTQGFNISIQGKDKMCLLDGTIGGNIFASHDFGKIELRHADGSIEYEPIKVYDIIRNAVHEYAHEPYENIIIKDLEDCSVELIEYRVRDKDAVIYNRYYNTELGLYSTNIAFEGNQVYDQLKNLEDGQITSDKTLQLVKYITYGDTIGYRLTDLTYPVGQDLILNAGSSITQLFDAIVKFLGDFEYFYDLLGRFVFQRKKIYYNISWTNAITNEDETRYDNIENSDRTAYKFTKGTLIESYNNKPNVTNIKNDFTIWGHMISTSNTELPVHLRCAIDDKPIYYTPLLDEAAKTDDEFPNGEKYYATSQNFLDKEGNERYSIGGVYDWRELIYRMAYDYSKSDVEILKLNKQIAASNNINEIKQLKEKLSLWEKTWDTGYIAYYTDMLDFWRLLYDPNNVDWVSNYYWNPEYVVCERKAGATTSDNDHLYIQNPAAIPYWIDFCDDAYLEKYKPKIIGRRTKVDNDSEVKAIFYKEVPNVLFIDPAETQPETDTTLSYARLNLTGAMKNYFQISTQGKSAKESLDSLLYTHTYYCESITLNCIPIYYLDSNVRISVYDETSGINGEYIIKSFSLQLNYDGLMSITATKAEDLIL